MSNLNIINTKFHGFLILHIKGEVIQQVSNYKYLGVTIDDRLQWSSHRIMRNSDVPTKQKLQFFCPFVSRSLRSFEIMVLVTTSMKGTPHQHC